MDKTERHQIEDTIELLIDVAEKKGAYSRNHLTHAENVINKASERAMQAIEILKGLLRDK